MTQGQEGYSIDPQTGQKEDETLHGPILDSLSSQVDKNQRRLALARAKAKYGLDDKTAQLLYDHK